MHLDSDMVYIFYLFTRIEAVHYGEPLYAAHALVLEVAEVGHRIHR